MNQFGLTIPAHPDNRSAALGGISVLVLVVGGFLTWSYLAPLSKAAVAQGEIRVQSHRKTVDHLEGGIIREILVKDGDYANQGDVLARLDTTVPGSNLEMLISQHDALMAAQARLLAQRDRSSVIAWPNALADRAGDPKVAAIMAGQASILRSQHLALETETEILQQKIGQLHSEIEGYRAQIKSLEQQTQLVSEEIKDKNVLVAKGLLPKPKLLELERAAASLEGSRGQDTASMAKAEQTIGETRIQIVKLQKDQDKDTAKELQDTQGKLAEVTEKRRQAESIMLRTGILAPESGLVVNLKHFTPGGVLKAGEPFLEIVPQRDTLVVECKVEPTDIDAVKQGLAAEVRLSAYKQRRTPTLHGRVLKVSADALTDEKLNKTYYAAEVAIDPDQLAAVPDVKLYPGMPADVMIMTGKRTALQYLVDPIRDSFWRSFREK